MTITQFLQLMEENGGIDIALGDAARAIETYSGLDPECEVCPVGTEEASAAIGALDWSTIYDAESFEPGCDDENDDELPYACTDCRTPCEHSVNSCARCHFVALPGVEFCPQCGNTL